jgi:hypothetical protein
MKANIQGVHPVLQSCDVVESLQFFGRLGFAILYQDKPIESKYAVVHRDGVQLHIQWADPGQWEHPTDRPAYRFIVSDVDALYREFLDKGCLGPDSSQGSPWSAPADTPWGTREFHLRDPGQNSLQFYRPL